jgi:hypothetical protein
LASFAVHSSVAEFRYEPLARAARNVFDSTLMSRDA